MVYQARDTIEGVRVALKVPYDHLVTEATLETFRHEVRLAAKLEHPHIQPLKHADFVEGHFVIVTSLGSGTLEERLTKRLSTKLALNFAAQMLDAVAFAHEHKIIHCDVKPDNLLLFPENQLRLTDFGIARVAHKTLKGSGAGTIGYVAPEQAMGQPSFRSDVFSIGLIMHRMLSGKLPEWPYVWPFSGNDRLRKHLHADVVSLIRKSTEVDAKRRYKDAGRMLAALNRIKHPLKSNRRFVSKRSVQTGGWKTVRYREFQRQFGTVLETRHKCGKCGGPVSEPMACCPWCGKARKQHPDEEIRFSISCPRCHRGLKSDWRYCAWCFGSGFDPSSNRALSDRRYESKCSNSLCDRKTLMAFMRYCPWCRTRVRRKWRIPNTSDKCHACGWGIARDYWAFCPWCCSETV